MFELLPKRNGEKCGHLKSLRGGTFQRLELLAVHRHTSGYHSKYPHHSENHLCKNLSPAAVEKDVYQSKQLPQNSGHDVHNPAYCPHLKNERKNKSRHTCNFTSIERIERRAGLVHTPMLQPKLLVTRKPRTI